MAHHRARARSRAHANNASATFIERWDSELTRIARGHARRFNRSADADDLAQAARIHLLKKASKYGDAPAPYVRKMIANAVLAAGLRGRPRQDHQVLTEDLADSIVAEESGSDPELINLVQQWIASLSTRHQTVCKLLYFEGATQAHVASILGISQPRVSQIHRELMQLGLHHFGKVF